MTLEHLLAPLTTDEFFSLYWEREPVHIGGRESAQLPSLFQLGDLDKLIGQLPPSATIRHVGGDVTKPRSVQAGRENLQACYQLFHDGSTLVVDRLHDLWEPVAAMCRRLVAETGMKVQANLYVTPRDSRGFETHWDGHDVLILQLEGTKEWELFPSLGDLPRPRSDGDRYTTTSPADRQVFLEAGDVLYIPRGTPHNARTRQDTSVHLTLGFVAMTLEDALLAAVERFADAEPHLRGALPRNWWSDDGSMAAVAEAWQETTARLGDEERRIDALRLLAGRVAQSAPAATDGHFASVASIPEITLDSIMELTIPGLCHVTASAQNVTIRFPGGAVSGPSKTGWAYQFIASTGCFRVRSIPGWYDDEERLLIVRVLTRAGLLRPADSESCDPHVPDPIVSLS